MSLSSPPSSPPSARTSPGATQLDRRVIATHLSQTRVAQLEQLIKTLEEELRQATTDLSAATEENKENKRALAQKIAETNGECTYKEELIKMFKLPEQEIPHTASAAPEQTERPSELANLLRQFELLWSETLRQMNNLGEAALLFPNNYLDFLASLKKPNGKAHPDLASTEKQAA